MTYSLDIYICSFVEYIDFLCQLFYVKRIFWRLSNKWLVHFSIVHSHLRCQVLASFNSKTLCLQEMCNNFYLASLNGQYFGDVISILINGIYYSMYADWRPCKFPLGNMPVTSYFLHFMNSFSFAKPFTKNIHPCCWLLPWGNWWFNYLGDARYMRNPFNSQYYRISEKYSFPCLENFVFMYNWNILLKAWNQALFNLTKH